MKTRIISGLVMAPLLILVAIGGHCVTVMAFIIALMGIREFFNGFNAMDIKPSYPVAVVSLVLLYAVDIMRFDMKLNLPYTDIYMLWLFISVLMSLLYMFRINERKIEDGIATITGIVYIGLFSYHVTLTERMSPAEGPSLVWLILITAFCTDIFAYFGGYFLGKHKLCPAISPKKTVEGAISGVLGAVAVSLLFGYICIRMGTIASDRLYWFAIVGFIASIASQFGDLTASIFKRKMGIKDYGKLIPGHGGVLDRVDSVLFTAPIVYYVFVLLHVLNNSITV